jgi:pimeloyl-ACP methyl ester carboxylesterase
VIAGAGAGAGARDRVAVEFADFVGSVTSREVALPFGRTRVWDMGSGPPVVLLHGIAASRRLFFRLVPLLAARRRVVVPLLRGEDLPAPRVTYDDLCEDLRALLDALDLSGVALFGASFGGAVALAYAARNDPRVTSVAVQGAFLRYPLRPADRFAIALSPVLPDRLGSAYFAWRVLRGRENALLAARAPGLEQLHASWCAATPFSSLRARVRLVDGFDLAPLCESIRVPAALAAGALDRVVPPALFGRLRAALPSARAVVWEGVGHLAALTDPALVAALVP